MRSAYLLLVLLLASCGPCGDPSLRASKALIVPSTTALAFGDVALGRAVPATLSLVNAGDGRLTLGAMHVNGSSVFSAASPDHATLGPNEVASLVVTFQPTALGSVMAVLVVESNADNGNALLINLTGNGVEQPDCDDHSSCTTDAYDVANGTCTHADVEGACDDGTVCTTADHCVAGVCVGTARLCEDGDPCTRNLCDAQSGCFFLADSTVCDDGNGCTQDSCQRGVGCHHATVLDGTPCNDGQLCTVADHCVAGACHGVRAPEQPMVQSVVETFATLNAVVLSSGDVLFEDGAGTAHVTRASIAGATIQAQPSRPFPVAGKVTMMKALPNDGVLVVATDGDLLRVTGVSIAGDGTPSVQGQVEMMTGRLFYLAAGSQALYVLDGTSVRVVDLTVPLQPALGNPVELPLTASGGLVLDEARHALYVTSGYPTMNLRLDVTDPPHPSTPTPTADQTLYLGAANARFVLASTGGQPEQHVVLDATTLERVGVLPSDVTMLALTDTRLLGTRGASTGGPASELVLLDATQPDFPQLSSVQASRWGFGPAVAMDDAHGVAVLPLQNSLDVWRFTTSGTPELTHVPPVTGMGGIQRLLLANWGVAAISTTALHRLSVGLDRTVTLENSTPLEPRWDLVSIDPNPSHVVMLKGLPAGSLYWGDAFVEDSPSLRGSVVLPPLSGSSSFTSLGSFIYRFTFVNTASGNVQLNILDARTVPYGTLGAPWAQVGHAQAAVQGGLVSSMSGPDLITVDERGNRVVALYGINRVAVFDVADPQSPAVVTVADLGMVPRQLLATGHRMLVLPYFGRLDNVEPAGTLAIFDVDQATPTGWQPAERVMVPSLAGILGTDGSTVVLATDTGLTWLDITRSPAVVMGSVATPEIPRDVLFGPDVLMVAGRSAVASVTPPCPP